MKFYIAEYNDNILGYCSYFDNYCLITGASIIINETYIKEEYRKLGISIFLYSKVFDVAFKLGSNVIKWIVKLKSKQHVAIEEEIGIEIDKNMMVVNIPKENMSKYLKVKKTGMHQVEFVRTYELTDVFENVKSLAKELKIDIVTDIYNLMGATFSSKAKVKIIVAKTNEEIDGILSFYDGYYSSIGKILIVDKAFVNENIRKRHIGQSLLTYVLDYAYRNNYAKVEMDISKFEVEKIEQLKEFGIFSYDNIRVAKYYKKEYLKLYGNTN